MIKMDESATGIGMTDCQILPTAPSMVGVQIAEALRACK
jgi:hypothetical protein